MGKVTAGFSMSVDGFVADAHDGVDEVFKWYFTGTTDREVSTGDTTFTMTAEGADLIEEGGRGAGVLVTARRTFDLAKAWGGKHPMDVPIVVVTHSVPEEWASRDGSPFTFVTGGVPDAIATARQIAGDRDVVVGAPSVTKQCLQLGLLDEIHIDLTPVLLGGGIRLFDLLPAPIPMEVVEASGNRHVTHITYRLVR
ncbi:MAG TPA: dihydrofolate reductase family protein [Candidatus Dormibacteraeota bacterium]|nr:dihydrofolate reductase family protein [Candidatus Dormibacteraeota bacterium]